MRRARTRCLIYLEDGGACFSAETCAPDSDLYNTTVGEGPIGAGGIFDFADERNPFSDYSVVYVPYCTGDVHLGDTTTEYAPDLTVHHTGYVNGTAALDFARCSRSGRIRGRRGRRERRLDRRPAVRRPRVGSASGCQDHGARGRIRLVPDAPRINEILTAWGFSSIEPPWLTSAGPPAERLSLPGLFIESGRHDPEIVFARHDYAYDEQQESWYPITGIPAPDLLSLIDANETQIEAAGVNLYSYVAPGDEHTALSDGPFYTERSTANHSWSGSPGWSKVSQSKTCAAPTAPTAETALPADTEPETDGIVPLVRPAPARLSFRSDCGRRG